MEKQQSIEELEFPIHTNTIALPNDRELRLLLDDYKPSPEDVLKCELSRTTFPQVSIENPILGTLADLCVRSLARAYGPDPLPMIAANPWCLQIHYDALDVDLPLKECYHVTSERFWKRVVLTKHPDKTLAIRRKVNWRNLGISMKYVEMVEACPVEDWSEEEMTQLALKVQEFVNEMHIKRLQSLQEQSFLKYYRPQTSSSEEDEGSIVENTESESSVPTSLEEPARFSYISKDRKSESKLALERQLAKEKAGRKQARRILREDKANARQEREHQRQRREARLVKNQLATEIPKKENNEQTTGVDEIEMPESNTVIIERRNAELLLKLKKEYNYPSEHCHHIDLQFVQHFMNLDTFTIEFLGPLQTRYYHHRHMNFSHDDIKTLGRGISLLAKLRVFRLRNSRMDAEKLLTIVRGLKDLPSLETVDFGYNNLQDDCASAFFELFENTSSIRNLELESNQLGEEVLRTLGEALRNYTKGCLEYLSLSRNPITDVGLHALVANILGSQHISSLSLRGVVYVTENGLVCCIANELLRKHGHLLKLDLTAVPIGEYAANEIIKSLYLNRTLLKLEYLASGLDEEAELDIAVILRRNKYIAENPFVGDQTKTDKDIDDWLNRTKNPILLKVLAEREKYNECLSKRSKELNPSPRPSRATSQPDIY